MNDNDILFCGDPHGCFDNVIASTFKFRPKAVVLLGDYNLEMPLENYLQPIIGLTQVLWIAGNHDHESQPEHDFLYHSAYSRNNLHLKVIEVDGVRIAGLGGIFLGRIWMPGNSPLWQNKVHWLKSQPASMSGKIPLYIDKAIWHHEFEKMKDKVRADILVSHEAPSCHRHGHIALDELAEAIGAKAIFHGHHHQYYQKQIGNALNVTGVALGGVVNLAGVKLM